MSDAPSIQHWLVTVARAAGLSGADDLDLGPETPAPDAWAAVSRATGVAEPGLAERVARHYRLAVADLDARDRSAVRLIPGSAARRLSLLPLRYTDRTLTVATSDPVGMEGERDAAALAARDVVPEVAPPRALVEAIEAAYAPSEGRPHQLPSIPRDGKGPHVLVVDDDPGTRALLRAALEARDYRVSEAPDGGDALEIMEMQPVHLVTLDLTMIDMDGMDVLREMRRRVATATVPVIVATGSDDPDAEMEALEAGADDFVVKPVDPHRFMLRVQAVLRRYGASTSLLRMPRLDR